MWSSFMRLHLATQIAIFSLLWVVLISYAHYALNTERSDRPVVRMGYMPVITNLAAPLLDYASKDAGDIRYQALKFSSFAEMAEGLRNKEIDAAFMIAPLSIVLRQQGEDMKVVYIGNRHESTLVARKDLNVSNLEDLAGKTIAVPMRYSGHNLSILELIHDKGLESDINIVEMNPPDMAAALAAGALDAYYVGEPFAAQTLKNGAASLVQYVEDVWPGFICNLVVVRNDLIQSKGEMVASLVQAAARSGLWAQLNQTEAAKVAARYWKQPESLVKYAMNTPDQRIIYNRFQPDTEEMQEIASKMVRFSLLETADISGLVEDKFAREADLQGVTTEISSILND